MALSQIQCLDDNHVNPRTNESKPDFLYCEDQRLALEAFLQDGREAFFKFLEARGMRGFLSDPELETFTAAVEPYDPSSELFPEDAEENEPPLSLNYWPELSDVSIPQMDLGWPDSEGYRGVTRATIYTQPPLDGQAHIKEVVRKMIAQAQKVIGVVMDVFTDVDIFRDLLDAGFRRKVSVYILLEHITLPHFLSMCRRADMHAGHLKHLRVRCTEGSVFHTRSSTMVKGRMGHRFMFIDGDKAASGTYSFTWMSSRLDKNLITVVTGQAVDAFDKLFRTLYGTSSSVDLRQVAKEPEPEPEPLPQPASVAPVSAAVARKLYNPKYALALGNPSPTSSAGDNSPKKTQSPENSRSPDIPDNKKERRRRGRASKEAVQEPPPLHPGLIDLEKASLISYLPTWPEPDPSKDVIGFINIRDANRPTQVHLQRSEMFGTSQAIKFSSPFSKPEETLPEVAMPRQLTAKPGEMNKVQLPQDKTKAQPTQLGTQTGVIKSKAEASEQNTPASGPKWDTAKTLNNEGKLHSNTPTDQDAGQNNTPHLNAHNPPEFSSKASLPITVTPSQTTNDPVPSSLAGSSAKTSQTCAVLYRRDTTQSSHLHDSNTVKHTQTKTHTDSPTAADHMQPQNSAEITPNVQSPTVSPSSTSAIISQSITSTSLSINNPVSITTSMTASAGAPSSSISPPPTSTTLTSPLPSSSPTPPIPKPRTIQLLIKESGSGERLPELSVIRALETSTGPQAVRDEPAVEKKKGPDTVPELQNDSGSRAGAQKDAENAGNIRDAPQHKQGGTAQDTKNNKAVRLLDDRAGMQSLAGTNQETQSDVLISGVPKAESVNIREIIPKDVEPETFRSLDCKVTPQKDCEEAAQAGAKDTERARTGCEFAEAPNETSKNVTQRKTLHASAPELQTISYGGLTPETKGVLDVLEPLKARKHTPGSAAHNQHISKSSAGDSTQTSPADTHVEQGSLTNTVKHNPESPSQELITKSRGSTHTPEKSLRLYHSDVHASDLRSQTPERESSLLAAVVRTPSPDGILPSMPSPDSRMHTPDPRLFTTDIRTPTPDGYVTPRTDSALSAASDEYYECSSSPLNETVGDQAAHRNLSAAEDRVSFTHTNSPNATTIATGPACINHIATLESTDRNSSSSGSQSLSGPASVSSMSSLHEERVEVRKEGKTNEENGREVDAKRSVAERRTEGDSQETQRRGRDEAKRPADHFKQGKDLTETVGKKNKEAQPQVLKRKNAPNQVTQGQSSNEGAERKRLSAGDLAAKRLSSEGEGLDKEKAADRAAIRPSGAVRKSSPKSSRETEGQKRLHTPPRPSRGQQPGSAGSSPSRPSRPPRPLSSNPGLGPRPWVGRQPNQAESKALSNSNPLLDNTSPCRAPSRPPPPEAAVAAGSAPRRKQADVSHGQQSLLTRQSLAAQGRARAGLSPNRQSYPRLQASFLHSHSNALLNPHSSQNQTVSPQEELSQEEGKASFGFTFGRLYSLKGLKDKMSKLPAQRGSPSSAVQSRKSTS